MGSLMMVLRLLAMVLVVSAGSLVLRNREKALQGKTVNSHNRPGGITAVFGLTGGDAEPEEFQQDAAQTFFFGDKEELAPPPTEGAAQNGELNDSQPKVEETQTFFAPQEQETDEENTFFNPEAEQEVVKEENSFFNANAEFEVDMPESTFLSPNDFTEQDYREKIAEQMGIDPNLVTVNRPAG